MQVELNLIKELLMVHKSVKQAYITSGRVSTDKHLKDALARLEILVSILKGE